MLLCKKFYKRLYFSATHVVEFLHHFRMDLNEFEPIYDALVSSPVTR